ncbi:hypothetical protein NOR53_3627, partial [gamma proteobacterium NOR5-3]
SYVPKMGDMPSAAKFRETLAARQSGRLLFSREEEIVFDEKATYGVLVHNPAGNRFEERMQSLGFIQVCIPNEQFTSWIAQIALTEMIEKYPNIVQAESAATPKPRLKTKIGKLEAGE